MTTHNVNYIRRCDSRIFLLRQLCCWVWTAKISKFLLISHIHLLLCYTTPVWLSLICGPQIRIVWFSRLSDTDNKYMYLEKVQRTVARIIFPDIEYEQRVQFLDIPLLYDFWMDLHVNDRAKFVFHFFYVSLYQLSDFFCVHSIFSILCNNKSIKLKFCSCN